MIQILKNIFEKSNHSELIFQPVSFKLVNALLCRKQHSWETLLERYFEQLY